MADIVVVGSINRDFVVRGARIPRAGETALGTSFSSSPGGKGFNQAVAAAKMGESVAMVGSVGSDESGGGLLSRLQSEGVNTEFVWSHPTESTGVALITVTASGENAISVAPGANMAVGGEQVEQAAELIASAKVVMVQLEISLQTVVDVVSRTRGLVILDPAPAQALEPELLRSVQVLTPNIQEGTAISGREEPEAVCRTLFERGAKSGVLTMGGKGVVIWQGTSIRHEPAPQVAVADSTAAGDTFNGALASCLARGASLDEAVHMAQRAAAISATRHGAADSSPTRAEVEDFRDTLSGG